MHRLFLVFPVFVFLLFSCSQPAPAGKGSKPFIIAEKAYPLDIESTPDLPPPPAPYTGPKKYCFEKHEGENGEDLTELQITIDNDSINGQIDYNRANQGTIQGKVEGIIMGTALNFICTYNIGGKQQKERMICKFDRDKLYRKSGPMVMEDSILELETPSKAVFILSMEQVKCK